MTSSLVLTVLISMSFFWVQGVTACKYWGTCESDVDDDSISVNVVGSTYLCVRQPGAKSSIITKNVKVLQILHQNSYCMCYLTKMQLICETLFPPRMSVTITFLTYRSYTSQSIDVVTTAIFIPVYLFIARQSRAVT